MNDLKIFIETSNFPSFNIAAKKLEISQPAISASIKRFEEDLGYKVFYRTKNGISLTPRGKQALITSKKTLQSLQSLSKENKGTIRPLIKLGCHPILGSYFLPKIFKSFSKDFPKYRIDVYHGLSRIIQSKVQSGEIDIALVVNPIANLDLIIKPVAKDKVRIWRRRKGLIDKRIIADTNLFQTANLIKRWKMPSFDITHIDSLDLIARMCSEGCGFAILPERIVKLLKLNLEVVPASPNFIDTFTLLYRPEFGKSHYEKRLIEIMRDLK